MPIQKLSDDDYRAIRKMKPPLKDIAKKFKISISHVVNIRKGRYGAHVHD